MERIGLYGDCGGTYFLEMKALTPEMVEVVVVVVVAVWLPGHASLISMLCELTRVTAITPGFSIW